jgi:hypothetical protein
MHNIQLPRRRYWMGSWEEKCTINSHKLPQIQCLNCSQQSLSSKDWIFLVLVKLFNQSLLELYLSQTVLNLKYVCQGQGCISTLDPFTEERTMSIILTLFLQLFFKHLISQLIFRKNVQECQGWWYMPVIPALSVQRQEDCKFEANLTYIVRSYVKKPEWWRIQPNFKNNVKSLVPMAHPSYLEVLDGKDQDSRLACTNAS